MLKHPFHPSPYLFAGEEITLLSAIDGEISRASLPFLTPLPCVSFLRGKNHESSELAGLTSSSLLLEHFSVF